MDATVRMAHQMNGSDPDMCATSALAEILSLQRFKVAAVFVWRFCFGEGGWLLS